MLSRKLIGLYLELGALYLVLYSLDCRSHEYAPCSRRTKYKEQSTKFLSSPPSRRVASTLPASTCRRPSPPLRRCRRRGRATHRGRLPARVRVRSFPFVR